jgi:hypothetical protein
VNASCIDRNHSKDRKHRVTRRPMPSVYRTTCPTLRLSRFSPSHLVFRRHSIKQHGGRARKFDASVLVEKLVPLKTKRAGSLYLVDHRQKIIDLIVAKQNLMRISNTIKSGTRLLRACEDVRIRPHRRMSATSLFPALVPTDVRQSRRQPRLWTLDNRCFGHAD